MSQLQQFLESKLGIGKFTQRENISFYCPFCHHRKRKLEVNLKTHAFNCWVCNNKGRSLFTLGRKLNWNESDFEILKGFSPNKKETIVKEFINKLPDYVKPLWKEDKLNQERKNALYYLKKRGFNITDVRRYGIHYCDTTPHKGYLFIPSFSKTGSINFYTTRAYYESLPKHRHVSNISKDVIGFELFVNWDLPIVLCEAPLDAMTISFNEIPLFGKFIQHTLYDTLLWKAKHIIIGLDPDALQKSYQYAQDFYNEGITVSVIELPQGLDWNKVGREKSREYIFNATPLTAQEILKKRFLYAEC